MKTMRNIVDDWNSKHSMFGTPVIITEENGDEVYTTTRSRAQLTSTDRGLIWVKGRRGPVDIQQVHLAREKR